MKSIFVAVLFPAVLFCGCDAYAAGSLLRIACNGDNAGAEIYINNKFKGECPLDIEVAEGTVKLRLLKKIDATHERTFEQEFRIGDGVSKKVEALLSEPRLNAAAQKLEDERFAAEKSEATRLEAMREETKRAELNAALAMARDQGAEVGNGKSFRECPDCPAMVLISSEGKETAIGQFEITRKEFAAFVNDTKREIPSHCNVWVGGLFTSENEYWQDKLDLNWEHPGFKQGDDHPVVCISWADAQEYVNWLSIKTGHRYQLPTAKVFHSFVDRVYSPWGPGFSTSNAEQVCEYENQLDKSGYAAAGYGHGEPWPCDDGYPYTSPVGSFKPNKLGIYDTQGNAAELLENINIGIASLSPAWAAKRPHLLGGDSWAFSKEVGYGGRGADFLPESGSENRRQDVGFRVMRYLVSQ